jgi:TonB family protein
MASATTSDFVMTATKSDAPPFSLIEQKSLLTRLAEELARAWHEFRRDPRGFLRNLFADDTKDAKRRRRLYFGLAGALAIHAVLLTMIAVIGWRSLAAPKGPDERVETWVVSPNIGTPATPESKPATPHGEKDAGGGHGGAPESPPPTRGVVPQSSSQPQIVKPLAPSPPMPSLPIPATVPGMDSPPVTAQLGVPNGNIAEAPAPGSGSRDGLGGGNDTGAGTTDGPGGGPGRRGKGAAEGNGGRPGGVETTPGVIDWRRPPQSGYTPFVWTYRARAITTAEAQANKAMGTVLLRVTLNANGTISDIEVVSPVPYMTESAIDALQRCKFRPATVNGVPVTLTHVLIRQEVHY